MSNTLAQEDCLQYRDGECRGEVAFRPSLTGTGTAIKRCDLHWERRLERDQEHRQVYPDSPIAPSWFDPTLIGEHWDSDY